jgi:hypothetical protein
MIHTGSSPVPGTIKLEKRDNTALFSYLYEDQIKPFFSDKLGNLSEKLA